MTRGPWAARGGSGPFGPMLEPLNLGLGHNFEARPGWPGPSACLRAILGLTCDRPARGPVYFLMKNNKILSEKILKNKKKMVRLA